MASIEEQNACLNNNQAGVFVAHFFQTPTLHQGRDEVIKKFVTLSFL